MVACLGLLPAGLLVRVAQQAPRTGKLDGR